jgi:hypothetical protein
LAITFMPLNHASIFLDTDAAEAAEMLDNTSRTVSPKINTFVFRFISQIPLKFCSNIKDVIECQFVPGKWK